jgi:hypothetical protein
LPDPVWMNDLEPLVDRRHGERRRIERRGGGTAPPLERRAGSDRRARQRRETVAEHLRNALQVLVHLATGRTLDPVLNEEIAAVIRRLWLAIQELERRHH